MTVDYREGVIQFHLDHTPGPALPSGALREINAWRSILHRLGLIGQDPARYGGVGYGNISRRMLPEETDYCDGCFIITATQTGGLPSLGPEHYALVHGCEPERNHIVSSGPAPPSSEAMTHGMLYALDPAIHSVMHVHSPEIWVNRASLGLATTAPGVGYGTPAMAEEVRRLLGTATERTLGIFVMGGHQDGIVSFGRHAEDAGLKLIRYLAQALQL